MKIVRVHTAALCILGLVSGMPVLALQAGTNAIKVAPSLQAGTNAIKVAPSLQAGTNAIKVAPSLQAGTNAIKVAPSASRSASVAASGVPTKARCEVDDVLGSVTCD
jgi:hypothetical protein